MGAARRRKDRGRRRARRAVLLCLLAGMMVAAGNLGYRGVAELAERRRGDQFYTRLASVVISSTHAAGHAPTPSPTPAAPLPVLPATTPAPRRSQMDFGALRESCPDAVGWLRLADSVIDYPVVQGVDNDFYLRHLADGTENEAGSIMLDQANAGDFSDSVSILHGHHMRSGAMFGDLEEYAQEAYFRAHPVFELFTPQGDYEAWVFAAYTVDGYSYDYPTGFADAEEFAAFVRVAVEATPYETGVSVTSGDRILLLSTCAYSYEGARFVVLGKLVEVL